MPSREAAFLAEVLELVPQDSVFGFGVSYDELLPDLEAAGYPVAESRVCEIPLSDKTTLLDLIQIKEIHERIDHFDIMHGQEYLLQSYDRMMFVWLSNKVPVSAEFVARYQLTLQGESWEFLQDDDSKKGWILLLE